MAAAGEGSLVIVADLADDLSGISELTSSAQIQSNETALAPPGGATATTTVTGAGNPSGTPNVLISKQADDTLLSPGDTVTYTLTAVNAGDTTATSVVVSDDFPDQAYFSYGSCNANGNGSCSESGGVLTWNLGSLGAGQSADLTFTMTAETSPAPPTGVTSLDNFATASYGGGGAGSDTSNTVTVSISTNPNLSIVKAVDPATGIRSPGDVVAYAIEVTNRGSGTATAVVVSDPVPAHTSFKAGSITADTGSGSFDAVNNRVLPAGLTEVDVDDGTLPSGLVLTGGGDGVDPSSVNVPDGGRAGRNTGYVPPGAGATSDMSVTISGLPAIAAPGASVSGTVTCSNVDGIAADNTDIENVPVGAANVFDPPSGTKTVDPAGNPVYEWRMVWINNGNIAANRVRVEDPIPAGTEYAGSLVCDARGPRTRMSANMTSPTTGRSGRAASRRIIWTTPRRRRTTRW